MTWEEKLDALQALAPASVRMRYPGSWCVSQHGVDVQRRGSGVLSSVVGSGETPEAAVEDRWRRITSLSADEYVVLGALSSSGPRRHVRWNGYMWADVPEPAGAGGGA